MIKYRIYELYPGHGDDDRLGESAMGEYDTIEEAIEAIRLHGNNQEYAIITVFRKET